MAKIRPRKSLPGNPCTWIFSTTTSWLLRDVSGKAWISYDTGVHLDLWPVIQEKMLEGHSEISWILLAELSPGVVGCPRWTGKSFKYMRESTFLPVNNSLPELVWWTGLGHGFGGRSNQACQNFIPTFFPHILLELITGVFKYNIK